MSIALLVLGLALGAEPQDALPGAKSEWNGYERHDFPVDGKTVIVVVPKTPLAGKQWIWFGEFWDHMKATDLALLDKGFHLVYMAVPNMFGSPKAVAHWNACYAELTGKLGFATKVALIGISRGGLYVYNWASVNADKVSCIYLDAGVCDFKSWPGGKGKGSGSAGDWAALQKQYGFATEAEAIAWDKQPVDSLKPLADAKVPLLHVYGDADPVVPAEENTLVVAERYQKLGGSITLIPKKGVAHHPHGLQDPTPVVDFLLKHSGSAK